MVTCNDLDRWNAALRVMQQYGDGCLRHISKQTQALRREGNRKERLRWEQDAKWVAEIDNAHFH